MDGLTGLPFFSLKKQKSQEGGFLELRYVRINQSKDGLLRPAAPVYEGITPSGMVSQV